MRFYTEHHQHSCGIDLHARTLYKWAFSEAAVSLIRHLPQSKRLHDRLKHKHGKGKALSILAHKLGRTVYFMLKRNQAFDADRFLANA